MNLGEGAYGNVKIADGRAIKTYGEKVGIAPCVQEYLALRYLRTARNVVKVTDVNFGARTLTMDLYDTNLHLWIARHWTYQEAQLLAYDLLLGVIEIHDRGLAHADLKPGNILIMYARPGSRTRAVIGDCGFVSLAEHSKAKRTAAGYRDFNLEPSTRHDMYSVGICLFNLLTHHFLLTVPGDVKNSKEAKKLTYEDVHSIIVRDTANPDYVRLFLNLIQPDKSARMTAREVINYLFNKNPPRPSPPSYDYHIRVLDDEQYFGNQSTNSSYQLIKESNSSSGSSGSPLSASSIESEDPRFGEIAHKSLSFERRKTIRLWLNEKCREYTLRRSRKGYIMLVYYLEHWGTPPSDDLLYMAVTLLILDACFGSGFFNISDVHLFARKIYSDSDIYTILNNLLSDDCYVDMLMWSREID